LNEEFSVLGMLCSLSWCYRHQIAKRGTSAET
jgi:hypothetical protein